MFFDFFSQFDYSVALALHNFAEATNGNLTWLMRAITYLADHHGLLLIVSTIVLMLFKRTRRSGVVALFALAFGALLTNIILKNADERLLSVVAVHGQPF